VTARELMTDQPVVLRLDDPVALAARHIIDNRYRNLPVVDEQGRFQGIFGVNCLLRLILPKAATMSVAALENLKYMTNDLSDLRERLREVSHHQVGEFVVMEVPYVYPDTPLMQTLLTMYQTKSSLPVVEPGTGKLLGMISYWEVLARVTEDDLPES
jgi:CBS domain-containing protein